MKRKEWRKDRRKMINKPDRDGEKDTGCRLGKETNGLEVEKEGVI